MANNLYRLTKQQQEQALKLAAVCAVSWTDELIIGYGTILNSGKD